MKLSWTRRVALIGAAATLGLGTTATLASNAHAATATGPYLARYPGAFVTVEYQTPSARWNTAVTNAIAQWNQGSNVKLTPYPSPRHSDGSSCVPDARSIRICVGSFGARATYTYDPGSPYGAASPATNVYRTTGASLIINTARYAGNRGYDSCETIGEALGMTYRWTAGERGASCMSLEILDAPFIGGPPPVNVINATDIAYLNQLYAKP
jgi:hypothetical protein